MGAATAPLPSEPPTIEASLSRVAKTLPWRNAEEMRPRYRSFIMRAVRWWRRLPRIGAWPGIVADYTAGTVIVLFLGPRIR